jgi:aldehyde dehydrogenase (NAD+)
MSKDGDSNSSIETDGGNCCMKNDTQKSTKQPECGSVEYTSFSPPSNSLRDPDRQVHCARLFKQIMASNTKSAAELVTDLRASFATGKTISAEYRKKQLNGLKQMVTENEDRMCDALYKDLRKPKLEAKMAETTYTLNEINTALSSLDTWMKPTKVSKNITQIMDKATIVKDPLGLVLVIGTWNYPIQLTLGPLVGAVAAGNCAIVKPSEISLHTTQLLTELLPQYLDDECYQIFNGGVPETTEILKERFDHIFYTGNAVVGKIVMRAAAEHLTPGVICLCLVTRRMHFP